METVKLRKKGLFIQAVEDCVKKAVEMGVVTIVIGLPVKVIFLSSGAVFVGSFAFKAVRFKISERR